MTSENRVLIFGGTSEGRQILNFLTKNKIPCDICVATSYGKEILPPSDSILEGRLTAEEMLALFQKKSYSLIIDATHPYAVEVSKNIRQSFALYNRTRGDKARLFRLERDLSWGQDAEKLSEGRDSSSSILFFNDGESCLSAIKEEITKSDKNILLTSGSKDLPLFCSDENVRKRLYVRVIPSMESLEICHKNQLEGRQIIAMQGPFSLQMNLAQICDYKIGLLVTKESGQAGGFDEKIEAACQAGIKCLVIKKPAEKESENQDEGGISLYYEVFSSLKSLFERLQAEFNIKAEKPLVILAGIGMGSAASMTCEVQNAIENASCIFGAERILNSAKKLNPHAKTYPYYLSRDIIPLLKENKEKNPLSVILFSGDTGFFSGAEKLYADLKKEQDFEVRIYPGISSMQYLFARCGLSWQNVTVLNLHGVQKSDWLDKLSKIIYKNKRIFFITSSFSDVQELGSELLRISSFGNLDFKVILGYQLSYPEEKIRILTPKDCQTVFRSGLYCGIIEISSLAKSPLNQDN